MHWLAKNNSRAVRTQAFSPKRSEFLTVEEMRAEQEGEVMRFLAERPDHTFGMAGLIRSNGLVSPHNRGSFYGCRDTAGRLQGVALIGHHILLETRCDNAIAAFSRIAKDYSKAHMLLGEQEKVQSFWRYYADGGQSCRLFCRELLFELRCPTNVQEAVPGLRLATLDDLDLVVPAHAQTAFQESGINPLEVDPEGFKDRCARRIEQGNTWVLVENRRLIFKTEVVTDSPEVVYLEGIWVNPEDRRRGYAFRCMSQLSSSFLLKSASVCVLVNEDFTGAQAFYKKVGFKFKGYYDTVFLKRAGN
jgi:uncharacterized protein